MAQGKKKETALTPEEKLAQALVPVEQQPYPVPENWCWSYVGKICSLIGGGTPSKNNPQYWDGVIPWASIKDIKGDRLWDTIDRITEEGVANSSTNICPKGSLILATRIEPGKTIISEIDTAINQDLKIVVSKLDALFLRYFFECNKATLESKSSGSTVQGITTGNVENTEFPLPPLAEQQRIVDRIEGLFAKLDEAREKVQEVVDGFESRKLAILSKAFSGEYTSEWRCRHNPSPVTVADACRQAAQQWTKKEQRLLAAEQDKICFTSKENGHMWMMCTIGAVARISNGSTPSRSVDSYWNGDIPWVSSGEVKNNIIYETEEKITKEGFENTSVKLLPVGTVLIAMIGEGKTRGQSAILHISATTNQNVAAIIIDANHIDSKYLWYWLQMNYAKNREKGGGSGPQALNCQRVRELDFTLPSIAEQTEIVRILDDLFAKDQQAKEAAEAVLVQIDLIKKSILARAFRGELGTNDPAEESAVELLKQVLAEDVPAAPRKRVKSISKEMQEKLDTELERKIIKLYFRQETDSMPAGELLSVSSKKFEIMETLRSLEQRGIIKKLPNGNYRLLE